MVLNPATPVETSSAYLHLLDKVTVMTIDQAMPDKQFIPEMLAKCNDDATKTFWRARMVNRRLHFFSAVL